MELTEANTYITSDHKGFNINIEMPDGSRNYLHHRVQEIESAIIVRELILENSIDHMNLRLVFDEGYYRIYVTIEDANKDRHVFHSRKLNLNDAIYERMQLIEAE